MFLKILLNIAWGAVRLIFAWLWIFLGIVLSVAIRLVPLISRLLVASTLWLMRLLNQALNGFMARNSILVLLSSGLYWSIVIVLFQTYFRHNLNHNPLVIFNPFTSALGIVVGLIIGVQVIRHPLWGLSTGGRGLLLGQVVQSGWVLLKTEGIALTPNQRTKTLWVLGQPGTGKSRGLAKWMTSDIESGYGVGFIDPHEDTYELVLKNTAILSQHDYSVAERLVVIDPLDKNWAVGFNPLQLFENSTPERIAKFFTDVTTKIWKIDSSQAPRMSWLMAHTFLALAELGLTLVELPKFLRDSEWRNKVLEHVQNEEVKDYFLEEFPTNERLRQEWTQSTLNKMGQFVMDPAIRLILGQRKSTVDFRKIMDNQGILLVNLSKGRLGVENSQLLGAFIVGQIQQAALSRVDSKFRPEFYLYLDEFQNYTTDHIQEILSESRKYNLSLVISHQYLAQLHDEQRDAVMNTYGTMACFRIGYQDADVIVREIFQPDIPPIIRSRWQFHRIGRLPLWLQHREYGSLGDEWERSIRELTNLKHREFWTSINDFRTPVKQRTLDMPEPVCQHGLVETLVDISGTRHARRKADVQKELLVERPRYLERLARGKNSNDSFSQKQSGIWS